ncbi:MAG: zinc-binding dehydrogenase, partial [Akkermansiaceae bacterium]|nr:zinc-binding dehydrogenase [Armatimonadota bacterium]
LVNVAAVSLNRGEVRMTRKPRPNWRPGWDFAGVVADANGSGLAPGTRVVGIARSGAWAEQVAVPADQVAAIPDSVSFAQAATLPVAGLTALHALIKGGFLLERPVLLTGATGGVGDFAIQLAKLAGAFVVAQIRRPEQEAQVREAGADAVVIGDRLTDAKQYAPFALIVDSVGGQILGDALEIVEEGTRIVSLGTSAGDTVTFDASAFYGKGMTSLYGMILFDELKTVEAASAGLARLAGLVAKGKLTPRVSLEAPWTDADAVATQLMERAYPGKAVLHVS